VGKSRTAVTNIVRLLQLPSGVQRLLSEGQISPGHARALLGTPDRGYQEMLAKAVVSEGLTVRAIEELVREHNGGGEDGGNDEHVGPVPVPSNGEPANPSASPRRLPPPGILELEELLSGHLNTRVKVDLTSKRGKVVVEFATLEDLERIYKLMVGRSAPSPV
jgi:ParB family chromosome partitioning protein